MSERLSRVRVSAAAFGALIGVVASALLLTPSPGRPIAVAPPVVPSEAPLQARSCTDAAYELTSVPATTYELSPDGRTVALGTVLDWTRALVKRPFDPERRRIQLFDLATRAMADLHRGVDPRWSHTGRYLSFYEPQGGGAVRPAPLLIYDTSSKAVVAQVTPQPYGTAVWAGDALVYWSGLEIHRWRDGVDELVSRPADEPWGAYISFSPDGAQFLAFFEMPSRPYGPSRVVLGRTADGRLEDLGLVWRAAWAPLGHRLALSYLDRRVLRDEDGRASEVARPWTEASVLWDRDGRRPLFVPLQPYFKQLPSAFELETFDGASASIIVPVLRQARFTPDGTALLGIKSDGWSAPTFNVYSCAQGPAAPSPRPTTIELFYPESTVEPWSARADGIARADWRDILTRDLQAAGLHPISIERLRTTHRQVCDRPGCSNGFALAVALPHEERDLAIARCFLVGERSEYVPHEPPALGGRACEPFYWAP